MGTVKENHGMERKLTYEEADNQTRRQYDRLELRIENFEYGMGTWPAVQIVINGVNFLDRVMMYEKEQEVFQGGRVTADTYAPVSPHDLYYDLSQSYKEWPDVVLFGCPYDGEPMCLPFYASVDVGRFAVVWYGFRGEYQRVRLNYRGLGRFVFEKNQYFLELKKLKQWLAENENE